MVADDGFLVLQIDITSFTLTLSISGTNDIEATDRVKDRVLIDTKYRV